MKILIIKLSSIGDIAHTSLILPMIKKSFPQAEITWLVEKKFREVLIPMAEVDRVASIDLDHYFSKFWENIKSIRTLQKTHFDYIIDFQGLLKSGILLSLMNGSTKWGYAPPLGREGSHLFYQQKAKVPTSIINVAQHHEYFINTIFSTKERISLPTIQTSKDKTPSTTKYLSKTEYSIKIALNPWSSYHTKSMPEEVVKTISQKIYSTYQTKAFLIYSQQEEHLANDYIKKYPLIKAPQVSLKALYSLLSEFDFYIGTDSGPSYLAQLIGLKGVVLFGPTNADRQFPPIGNLKATYSHYDCPIMKVAPIRAAYRCKKKNCGDNLCMKNFTGSEITEILKKSL